MDKNTILGFVLIALVLIGFSWYNQPSAEQIEAQRTEDSIAQVIKANAEKKQKADEAARKAQAEAAEWKAKYEDLKQRALKAYQEQKEEIEKLKKAK